MLLGDGDGDGFSDHGWLIGDGIVVAGQCEDSVIHGITISKGKRIDIGSCSSSKRVASHRRSRSRDESSCPLPGFSTKARVQVGACESSDWVGSFPPWKITIASSLRAQLRAQPQHTHRRIVEGLPPALEPDSHLEFLHRFCPSHMEATPTYPGRLKSPTSPNRSPATACAPA